MALRQEFRFGVNVGLYIPSGRALPHCFGSGGRGLKSERHLLHRRLHAILLSKGYSY